MHLLKLRLSPSLARSWWRRRCCSTRATSAASWSSCRSTTWTTRRCGRERERGRAKARRERERTDESTRREKERDKERKRRIRTKPSKKNLIGAGIHGHLKEIFSQIKHCVLGFFLAILIWSISSIWSHFRKVELHKYVFSLEHAWFCIKTRQIWLHIDKVGHRYIECEKMNDWFSIFQNIFENTLNKSRHQLTCKVQVRKERDKERKRESKRWRREEKQRKSEESECETIQKHWCDQKHQNVF